MGPVQAQHEEWVTKEKQDAVAEAVKALDAQLYEANNEFITETTLVRYLRARKGDVKAASKLLHSTLAWRTSIKIETLSIDEFGRELSSGKMYVAGNDSEGRSILVTRKKSDGFDGRFDHYVRWLAFTLESTVRAMQDGAHQWVWILDMKGYSRANSPPLNVSLATLRILADHYPERLARCFFVDAPSIFSWLWSGLSPFIDPVTKNKILFIDTSKLPSCVVEGAVDGISKEDAKTGSHQAAGRDLSPAMQAFLPYVPVWREQYDEVAYRKRLATLGW